MLLVVGVGKSRGEHRSEVWLGRLPSARMPAVYVASDCLVHLPTFDYWPHAINEALAAGLPVVATPDTGIPDGMLTGPGCRLVCDDSEVVAEAIRAATAVQAAESLETREAIRASGRPWGVERMAERFIAVAERALRTDAEHSVLNG